MEITKCYFAFFTIVLSFMCTETAEYGADRIRQELSYIRDDISALFKRTDQLNISVVESCGPCVSGNTSCLPMANRDGRQDMVKVNNNKVLLKYRSLIKAFGSEKKINRELQHQLRSMGDNLSAIEKVSKENTGNQQSQLQSMEDRIMAIEKKANEGNGELLSRLQSVENSISAIDKTVDKKRDRKQQRRLQLMEASISTANERYREQQSRLRSVEDSISTIEKKANDGYEELLSRLQSMENSISAANERDRELQSHLRSLEESIEDKISNMYRDLRNDMISFMATVSNAETTSVKSDITTSPIININCRTVPESGVYTLHLEFIMSPVNVYCDQETDGGGWIVFMRRQDGSVNFYRSWLDYKQGFGSPDGEFWAGNELLYKLTKERPTQLRIDMEDFDGNTAFAMYEEFQIGAETDKYRLHLSGYSGTAGDSLIDTRYSRSQHAGMQFSTFDSDNDKSRDNCAAWLKSGWWYNWCFDTDLNTQYSQDKTISLNKGIVWYSWKGAESLKRVEMKIR